MLVYVLLVVLVIIVLLLLCAHKTNDTCPAQNILTPAQDIAIINKSGICSPELQNYCMSWGHKLYDEDITVKGPVLHLYEAPQNININQSMNIFAELLTNSEYIVFDNCDSYITKSKKSSDGIRQELREIELAPDVIKNVLKHGHAHLTKTGLLLHRAYLDNIFSDSPLPFIMPHIAHNVMPARIISNSTKIPKIIHQTFETHLLPEPLREAMYSWITRNPEYEHRYYDDRARRNFIKQHFDVETLWAYDKLIPGAYRADLWRYCVIYQHGGYYVDIKLGALAPLSMINKHDTELILVNDNLDGSLLNGFFGAVPKHPAILACIKLAVNRVLNEEYGPAMIYPTGPLAMGAAILPMFGFKEHIPNGLHDHTMVYSHYREDGGIYVKDQDDNRLIKFRHNQKFTEEDVYNATGRPHYKVYWKNRTIYRK